MAHWLNKLRKKPKHVRDNIAFGSSVGMTLVVALVWFVAGGTPEMASDTKTDSGFFKTFKEGFNKQMAAARESFPSKPAISTPTTTKPLNFEPFTEVSSSTASSTEPKPVLIEIINASGTASSSPDIQ